jgi:hypothetical protein
MDAIFASYAGQVAPIEIHYWSGDPFYMFNPTEIYERGQYYGLVYVPTFRFDGEFIQDPSTIGDWYNYFRQTVDSLLATPSPVRINLDQYPSQDGDSVYVSFDVVAVDSIEYTPRTIDVAAFLAVTEEYHRYPFPVAKWWYALRDYVPGASGYSINLQKGDSLHFDWTYPIDPEYINPIFTNVFVQVTDTMMVEVVGGDPPETTIVQVNVPTMLQTASKRVVDVASVAGDHTAHGLWLGQNAPNPFTSKTAIAYELNQAGVVRLSVYTPTGRLVTDVVDAYMQPGSYSAAWDGLDRSGHRVGSGVYYYRLDAGGMTRTGRMVLLR